MDDTKIKSIQYIIKNNGSCTFLDCEKCVFFRCKSTRCTSFCFITSNHDEVERNKMRLKLLDIMKTELLLELSDE